MFWQQGHAVFIAFCIAHEDRMLTKVDVFDTQAQAFKPAQAGAVEELGLEPEGGVVDV